jgi:phage tail sheath gpL-like
MADWIRVSRRGLASIAGTVILGFCSTLASADTLSDIKGKGTLTVCTGVMGSSMCGHLISAAFSATVFNRSRTILRSTPSPLP